MKNHTFLLGLFTILASFIGVYLSPAAPTLGIAPAGNEAILFFDPSSENYIIQSTTNLNSTNWITATDAVMITAAKVPLAESEKYYRLLPTNAPAGMALIPAGSFTIGNSIGDLDLGNAVPTNVYISAFFMDTNLVSYGLWQSVYTFATGNGYSFTNAGAGKAANHPVHTVNWYDSVKWCNARSQQEGLTAVYYTDAGFTQLFTTGETTNVFANWSANGYRLPTEAEWEKAARGGLSGMRYPWGNLISGMQANYVSVTNAYSYDLGPDGTNAVGLIGGYPHTSPVGSFDINGYGLHDMAGNVLVWCWDWYRNPALPYQPGSPYLGGTDPRGPATGTHRIERGGSWGFGGAGSTRCAARNWLVPTWAFNTVGLRCVRGL